MEAVSAAIQAAERCLIISHIHPDGDAVGSLVALSLGLQQLNKEVVPVLVDGVPQSFQYLLADLEIQTELPAPPIDPSQTLCITVDLADSHRTGEKEKIRAYSDFGRLAMVDHHPAGDMCHLAQAIYQDIDTSSCAELIYHLLISLGVRLTPAISTALMTGMYTDTGGFQFENTSRQTLEVGAELMKRGARLNTIVDQTTHQKSIAHLRLTGLALERLSLRRHNQIAISYLNYADLEAVNGKSEDIEGIVNQLNVLPGSKLTILLVESKPGRIRGSIRSNTNSNNKIINVTPLARLLGGGGHARASGFTIGGAFQTTNKHWQIV